MVKLRKRERGEEGEEREKAPVGLLSQISYLDAFTKQRKVHINLM